MAAWVVLSTAPDARTAKRLARELVRKKLAACVTCVDGGFSTYRWKGKVESAKETLLVVKTAGKRLKRVLRQIQDSHPYECPEVLALPVGAGSKKYLDWIEKIV